MKEKVLIESKPLPNFFLILGILVFVIGFLLGEMMGADEIWYFIYAWSYSFYYVWPSVILLVLGMINKNCKLIVTDKIVRGKAILGQRVDLPLDMISFVGTSLFWGLSVRTSSGVIRFTMIKNRDDVYSVINKLLIERQSDKQQKSQDDVQQNDIEELKKYKELLDNNVITQDEFDKKKQQILKL